MITYNDEKWLNIKEVNQVYNISIPTIYRKMKEKKWRYIKAEGKYHINNNDLSNKQIIPIYYYKCGE